MARTLPVLALTPGEPAGIGPDLAAMLAQRVQGYRLAVIADPALLASRAARLGLTMSLPEWRGHESEAPVSIVPVSVRAPTEPGRLDVRNAPYVMQTLERAVAGCLEGEFDALVTGPVHKGVINDAGIAFTGHTEFLAERAGGAPVVMLLASDRLKVALATTHLPLAEVSRHITREHLASVLRILQQDLQVRFGLRDPLILVCGLNPHAGESGHLGREEIDVIEPVVAALREEGMRLRGPVPADTAFTPQQLERVDAVLAMYHDQGLPVLKYQSFGRAVNVTLGLPFIRTSVDHGTALDLAASGRADPGSLEAAVKMAREMISARSSLS